MVRIIVISNSISLLTADFLLFIISIFYPCHKYRSLVREDQSVFLEILIAGIKYCIKHALIKEKVAHPLGDDNIDLIKWKLNLLHLTLQQGNFVCESVDSHDLFGLVYYGGHIDADNVLSTGFSCEPNKLAISKIRDTKSLVDEHGENSCTTTNIKNYFVLEYMAILVYSMLVRSCAHFILLPNIRSKRRVYMNGISIQASLHEFLRIALVSASVINLRKLVKEHTVMIVADFILVY
jgi:hypothetical protein